MGVRKEEAKRGPGTSKCFSESPQPVSLHPQAMRMVQSLLCKEGVFRKST